MSSHWLATAAARSGLGDATLADLAPDLAIEDAWSRASGSLGIDAQTLAEGVAKAFRLQVADLGAAESSALALLPEPVARKFGVFPLRSTDRELIVGTADPMDHDAEREVGFASSRRAVFEVAPPASLADAIDSAYTGGRPSAPAAGSKELDRAYEQVRADQEILARAPEHTRDLETVKTTRLVLMAAVDAGANEIHIAPTASTGRIQFRVGGKLEVFMRLPFETLVKVVDRLRGMAGVEGVDSSTVRYLPVRIKRQAYRISIQPIPGYPHQLVLGLTGEAPAEPVEGFSVAEEGGHILVVDDDESQRLLMRTVLGKAGFATSEADDGITALPALEESGEVDAILLDLMMTGMDGLEVLRHVRASIKMAALPVVILTGSEDPEDERRLLEAGANDYLRKPVDPAQLVARMRAVLRRARAHL